MNNALTVEAYILKRQQDLRPLLKKEGVDAQVHDDLLQDVAVKAVAVADFTRRAALGRLMRAWLRDEIKAHRRLLRREKMGVEQLVDEPASPVDVLYREDLIRYWHPRALRAMSVLEGVEGKAFTMHFLERLTLEETAKALGVSKSKARSLMDAALGNVRNELRKTGSLEDRYWVVTPIVTFIVSLVRKPAAMVSALIGLALIITGITIFPDLEEPLAKGVGARVTPRQASARLESRPDPMPSRVEAQPSTQPEAENVPIPAPLEEGPRLELASRAALAVAPILPTTADSLSAIRKLAELVDPRYAHYVDSEVLEWEEARYPRTGELMYLRQYDPEQQTANKDTGEAKNVYHGVCILFDKTGRVKQILFRESKFKEGREVLFANFKGEWQIWKITENAHSDVPKVLYQNPVRPDSPIQ